MKLVVEIGGLICSIGAMCCCYLLYQQNLEQRIAMEEQHRLIAQCSVHVESLEKSCVALSEKIAERTVTTPQIEKRSDNNSSRIQKWEAWCKLKQKLEVNEDCSEELKNFNELFASNDVILRMVSDLVHNEQRPENVDSGVVGFMHGMARKIMKKIDHNKLYVVSGYVLLDE